MTKPQQGDELVFLPLGGSDEIGMNLNAYGYGPPDDRRWIIVDIGVSFGGQDTPGVDVILPDPTFLEEERDNILAIVLTHAHEDHIGAIGWLWPRLKAPVYATPFTAALVREKLREHNLLDRVKLHEVSLNAYLQLGPFGVEYVTLTHSIPEPNGLAIRTPLGLVFHTGDWKIDEAPQIGAQTDTAKIKGLADEGVLAMVCDSTNVFVEGRAGSEADVRDTLKAAIQSVRGKVAVTAFASNVARLQTTIEVAKECGRNVCLVGRSMKKVTGAAQSVGLLQGIPPFMTEEQAAGLPPENVLYLCTGSQGEARAALARIAAGDHRYVSLGQGDAVLFSSRMIPGNELAITALQNTLARRGVRIITDRDEHIHVSGHPCRDELKDMYGWARPQIAVPVHGERRHILEHAAFAKSLQVPMTIAPHNGAMIRLAPGAPEIIDETPAGRLYVDGGVIVEADNDALKERKRIAEEGFVSVSLAIAAKKHTILAGPAVRTRGLSIADEEEFDLALDDLAEAAEAAFQRLPHSERGDEDVTEAAIVRAVRKAAERAFKKRPLVEVTVLRV
jgi:ribonuclease J